MYMYYMYMCTVAISLTHSPNMLAYTCTTTLFMYMHARQYNVLCTFLPTHLVLVGAFGSRIHAPCNRAYAWYMYIHVHVQWGLCFVIGGTLCSREYAL